MTEFNNLKGYTVIYSISSHDGTREGAIAAFKAIGAAFGASVEVANTMFSFTESPIAYSGFDTGITFYAKLLIRFVTDPSVESPYVAIAPQEFPSFDFPEASSATYRVLVRH